MSVHGTNPSPGYFLQFSLVTSKSELKNDFRSLKGTASDDTGGMSESTAIPNLSYAAGVGMAQFREKHRVYGAVLQSMDRLASRTISTPFGRDFILPGQILGLRYTYAASEHLRLTASGAYIDVFGFTDPSAGLIYRGTATPGVYYRLSTELSLPVNKKSIRDNLTTRATARAAISVRRRNWNGSAKLSHSVPFYGPPATAPSSISHGASASGGGPVIRDIEEIDLVLSDREVSRTMTGLNGSLSVTDSLSLSSNLGVAYLRTARGPAIWISNARVLGVAYSLQNVELATNFNVTSDINNYAKLSVPKFWSTDVTLSYRLGQPPRDM